MIGRTIPDQRSGSKGDPQSLERAKTDYERDLKPYYEKECAKGDQSACQTLVVGEGTSH